MAATARPGFNADLSIGADTNLTSATSIGNVLNVGATREAAEVDVTPITSTGHRAYLAGLRSATITFELAYDDGDTEHTLLKTQWASGATNYYFIEWPGQAGTATSDVVEYFRGFITSLDKTGDPDDKYGGNVTIRMIEAPVVGTG